MAKLDFTAYIWQDHSKLDPAYIARCKAYLAKLPRVNFEATSSKPQAASYKQQATST